MVRDEHRAQFYEKLPDFVNFIKLNERLKNSLENHQYFEQFKERLKDFTTEREKVLFILFAMTREKSTSEKLVQFLRESGQTEVADHLEILNTSSGPIELTMEIEIKPINKASAPKKDLSNCYNLLDDPRGKCIIINNMEDQQKPDVYNERGELVKTPKGLERETLRFEYIFKELYFDVQVLRNLNAIEMKQKLIELRGSVSEQSEAFVLILISHGYNEQVCGYDACELMRKIRFGEISTKEDKQKAKDKALRDVIGIKDITEIFSERNCGQLKSRPKLYFFICCREDLNNTESNKIIKTEEVESIKVGKIKTITNDPKQANIDTFVSYACSEGFTNFYKSKWGMSYFGQAFTHSIAQYAVNEPLSAIMTRTSTRLKKMYEKYGNKNKNKNKKQKVGSYAIEVNTFAMGNEVYFNPGIVEK